MQVTKFKLLDFLVNNDPFLKNKILPSIAIKYYSSYLHAEEHKESLEETCMNIGNNLILCHSWSVMC